MKIVFVSQPLSTGGAERVVAVLANRFCELGHEVKIVVIDNGDSNIYSTHKDVEFVHIDKPSNPLFDLFNRAKKMRRYFQLYRPDVILSFTTQKNVSTLLATLFTKHRVIISERNNPYKDPQSRALRLLRKILYFTADGYVFQTEGAKEFFSRKIQRRSCVIPNPIRDDLPQPWNEDRTKRIVMVNRLDPQKNLKMAIDAFQSISEHNSDYCLEIFGKGPLQKDLTDYILSKGLEGKVFLKGFCSHVNDEIKDAAIYLMTSDFEGMSNSLMEALALGLPCISTDHPTGGARALIKDHVNGILIPVGNNKACVLAIEELISNKDLCDKLSANAIKIRDHLSSNYIADMWSAYIRKMLEV